MEIYKCFDSDTKSKSLVIQRYPRYVTGLDIHCWPGGFSHSAGQFGPVDLAVRWPEGASGHKFGLQGCSFCVGPNFQSAKQI